MGGVHGRKEAEQRKRGKGSKDGAKKNELKCYTPNSLHDASGITTISLQQTHPNKCSFREHRIDTKRKLIVGVNKI